MGNLKRGVTDRTLSGRRLKEYLIRVIYVEMLGHDASFGYMKSVELSASANLAEKRVAYLAAALCLAPENDFRMMLVNRLQRDLQSANVLECSIALSASVRGVVVCGVLCRRPDAIPPAAARRPSSSPPT